MYQWKCAESAQKKKSKLYFPPVLFFGQNYFPLSRIGIGE